MKKIFLLFLSYILLFSNVYAKEEILCDSVNQSKIYDNDKLSYICINWPVNNVVFDWKIIAKYPYWTIWDYAISKNNSVAVVFADSNDVFNQKVYLNNKQIWNYKYYSLLKFNNLNNDLYFVSWDNESNKLILNWKDITPKSVKNIYEFSFTKKGDNFMYWCWDYSCDIYKNQKLFSTSSTNLIVKDDTFWYIKDINWKKILYINNKEVYKTFYEIWNLYIDTKWNYYFIEKRQDKNYVIKNWKEVSRSSFDISQFIVSEDMENFYFFTQSQFDKNFVDLVYNDSVVYSSSWWINIDIKFYKDTVYFQKLDGCYYNSYNETDKDFCWKWDYEIKISNDWKNILLLSRDMFLFKINWKIYDISWKWKINFLWFTKDSKKMWLKFAWLDKEKLKLVKIK